MYPQIRHPLCRRKPRSKDWSPRCSKFSLINVRARKVVVSNEIVGPRCSSTSMDRTRKLYSRYYGIGRDDRVAQRFRLLDRSSESFGRFADYESPGCKADMAEGSAEEEQSSTAAPASPPADLRTLNTRLSPPYHHQPHLHPRLQHLPHPNMLATAVPPRHSLSMLSHQVKTEPEFDGPCDVPLNLKSEVSP